MRKDEQYWEDAADRVVEALQRWQDDAEAYTENEDYASAYYYIVDETSYDWPARIHEWLTTEYGDYLGHTDWGAETDRKLASHMAESLDSSDCEAKYGHNEYAAYSGPGCQLCGFDIGEIEEQINILVDDVLRDLWEAGDLELVLTDVDNRREFCMRGHDHWNPESKRWVHQWWFDPQTPFPTFLIYCLPGGRWDFVVPDSTMKEKLAEAICDLCREADDK